MFCFSLILIGIHVHDVTYLGVVSITQTGSGRSYTEKPFVSITRRATDLRFATNSISL